MTLMCYNLLTRKKKLNSLRKLGQSRLNVVIVTYMCLRKTLDKHCMRQWSARVIGNLALAFNTCISIVWSRLKSVIGLDNIRCFDKACSSHCKLTGPFQNKCVIVAFQLHTRKQFEKRTREYASSSREG